MYNAIKLPLSEFPADQVKRYQLTDYVSEVYDDEMIVTFRHRSKPYIIPYRHNDQLQLTIWSDPVKTIELENMATYYGHQIQKPRLVISPALMAYQNGTWFDVASRQICGIMKRTRNISVSILVKPASDYFERMTHYGWEPVCVGDDSDPGKND